MHTTTKGKEIRIPGPDHPITISPAESKLRVTVAGRIVAESTRALRLEERGHPPVYYLPRDDADMSFLVRTTHYTLHLLQHYNRRNEIGICRLDVRKAV
jgi:uncharacterized protein (DUF427 family)